jgi:hypothetical protein
LETGGRKRVRRRVKKILGGMREARRRKAEQRNSFPQPNLISLSFLRSFP